jgi:hypothetical protein
MVSRNVVIAIVILILIVLGFYFVSNMTANVITGSTANDEVVENELFRIDEVDDSVEGDVNDSQDNNRSG